MMRGLFIFCVRLAIAFALGLHIQDRALANIDDDLNPNIEGARLKVAKPFVLARTHLLNAGWKPVRLHLNDGYGYAGTETAVTKLGFFEVDSCTEDAGSICMFYYRKNDKCLRVDTVGEQIRDMKVTQWMHECSPDDYPNTLSQPEK